MHIYGRVVDSATNAPIANAKIQRLYPDGQNYSDAIYSDANGDFLAPFPDLTYKWYITAAGYKSKLVVLTNWQGGVMVVGLVKGSDIPGTTTQVTPSGTSNAAGSNSWIWIAAAGAAGLGLAVYKKWIKLPKFLKRR